MADVPMNFNPYRHIGVANQTDTLDFTDAFIQGAAEREITLKSVVGTWKISRGVTPDATKSPTLDASSTSKSTIVMTIRNDEKIYVTAGATSDEIWIVL